MSRLRLALHRLIAMAHVRGMERDLSDEIASHLAEATEEHIARGLSPEDARNAALRGFGGIAQTRELHRDVRSFTLIDDLRQDLRYAVRRCRRNPAFALVAILTLALGIGANTAIFTLLDAVVFKPLPVPAAHELLAFHENGPEGAADAAGGTGRFLRFSYPRFLRLRDALGDRGSMAACTRSSRFAFRLTPASDRQFLSAQLVSDRYFETLGVSAARGRILPDDDGRIDRPAAVAVISDGFWRRVLGASEAAIGQTLAINEVTTTIVGVAPATFVGLWTDSEPDVWLPIALQHELRYHNNSSSYATIDNSKPWATQEAIAWLNLVARIPRAMQPRAIAQLQAANQQGVAELAAMMENPKSRSQMLAHTLVVHGFAQGFSGLRGRYAVALFALTAMVALVLLVTCANIANLMLARAAGQAREMAIRLSLGAGTGRLVRQQLIESLTLAAAGGAGGVVLGNWASALLAREVIASSSRLPAVFAPDRRVLVFAAAVSICTALVFGLVPAFRAIAAGRTAALGSNQRAAVGQAVTPGMRWLMVGQLALSVAVVFAAMLLGRTLINVIRIDPGFATERLVTASFDPIDSGYKAADMPALAERVVLAARTVPGVVAASVSRCGLIAGCVSSAAYRIDTVDDPVSLYQNWISPGYFRTVGIPLVAGREFSDADAARNIGVAIINESIATRYFPGQSAIGRRLGQSAPDTEIIAVVRDAHTQSLHDAPVPMVYLPIRGERDLFQIVLTNLDVRVDGDAGAAVPAIRNAIKRAEPGLLLGDVGVMSRRLSRDLNRERIVAYLAFSFGALTLLLAALGLYGVLSHSVARRTQEIGVRMALGAARSDVMTGVLAQSARLTTAGIAVGLLGAAAGARYLSGLLYGVGPLDPATIIAVPLAIVLVTMLASYLPARRATKVDPLVALRCD